MPQSLLVRSLLPDSSSCTVDFDFVCMCIILKLCAGSLSGQSSTSSMELWHFLMLNMNEEVMKWFD